MSVDDEWAVAVARGKAARRRTLVRTGIGFACVVALSGAFGAYVYYTQVTKKKPAGVACGSVDECRPGLVCFEDGCTATCDGARCYPGLACATVDAVGVLANGQIQGGRSIDLCVPPERAAAYVKERRERFK